jgi:7,8-dihydropterin-6-yl-methyl-4-(beta-D-ribofuranosyl)aminobenzene 5'-phosphate synthase
MKITTLLENTRLTEREDLTAQHGLALHIEWQGRQILFDSGPSAAFWDNAELLGVDLSQVEIAVISHHHYDHGGGLRRFLEGNPRAKIYLRRFERGEPEAKIFWIFGRYVGLDKKLLARYPERFEFIEGEREPVPGAFILTKIEKPYPIPRSNQRLWIKEGMRHRPDDFDHELLLVIRQESGLVIFSGCSHQGILNLVEATIKRFPGEPIRALLGGFHTMADSELDVQKIGERLLEYPIQAIYTGHCTGKRSYEVLRNVMGEKLEYLPTGRVVQL